MPPVIVIGFLGGFIKHDNLVYSEVQLAARLRKAYPIGVDVETFESYRVPGRWLPSRPSYARK